MISVAITVRDRSGVEKPTPTIHIQAEGWSAEVVNELLAVLCERAGAIGGMGVVPAKILRLDADHVRMMVWSDTGAAASEPLRVPAAAVSDAGFLFDTEFRLQVRPYRFSAIDVLDLHLPVFSGERVTDDQLRPSSPYIFGTAFPIWHGGLFATAAHVLKFAKAAGEPVLGRLGGDGPIPGYGIERAETFDNFDFALLKCPGLERFPPVTLEMVRPLRIFDQVTAVGYPFSVDPEHLVATHRGFAGHVVACRQLYNLPGQPIGYELSFQTPPGMSGAPLMHRGEDGVERCYGFIVQQLDTEFAGVHVRLGLAVAASVLCSIRSQFLRADTVSAWFGVSPAPPPPPNNARSTGALDARIGPQATGMARRS